MRHCLEKDRENRFQTAKDVTFALSEASSSSSTTTLTSGVHVVPPPGPKRGKGVWIAAAVVLLLAAAGLFLWKRPKIGSQSSADGSVRRVAVLPFENLGAAEDDYFADGIADAIRGKLASVPGLEVIARGSSTPYKKTTKTPQQIAKELNARYLLTATVRWQKSGTGNRVQVSPELVEIKESEAPATKWQQPFDASLTDVFQVQSDIAAKVVDSLGVALAEKQEKIARRRARPRTSPRTTPISRARRPRPRWPGPTSPALRKGLGYYEQAVALDPGFSEAWARISTSKTLLFSNSVPDPALAKAALEAARKSIELAPDKPDGEMSLGTYYRIVERDHPRALEEYKKAERLAPGTPDPLRSLGRAEMQMGRWQDAIAHYDEAERLDPKNAINVGNAAQPLAYLRRCGEARQAIDRSLALAPNNLSRIEQKLETILCEGDIASARALDGGHVAANRPRRDGRFFSGRREWLLDAEDFSLLRRLTPAAFDDEEASWAYAQAWAAWRAGESGAAREYAEKAVPLFEAQVKSSPRFAQVRSVLGQMLAMAGRKADAIREAVRATELEPVEKSAFRGADLVFNLAQTYMLAGEPDKAIDTLDRLLKMPFSLTPAWLEVDPTFDSLRQNPRFQKLVAAK